MPVTEAARPEAPGDGRGLAALGRVDDRVARVWQVREQTEYQAAMHFAHLAGELAAVGFPESLCQMAVLASRDELEHAVLCRGVVVAHAPDLAALRPRLPTRLGPAVLSRRQRAIYQAVALSCVTETLSVALLLEMRSCVRDPPVLAAATQIVRDESRHSQIGWAVLEHAGKAADLSWLSPHIGPMLRAALDSEALPATPDSDLGIYGILPASRAQAIAGAVVQEVIFPGLEMHGIDTSSAWPL